jgi:hypothetical protein
VSTIAGLIADFQSRGIVLSAADGQIQYRAPKDALSEADKVQLRGQRADIIAFLQAREAGRGLRAVRRRSGPLTASVAQEMFWRFSGGPHEGKPVALNIATVGRFRQTDAEAVTKAVRDVIRRHDPLRTHIRIQGEAMELSLNDAAEFAVEQDDLSHLDGAAASAAAEAQIREYCSLLNPVEGQWQTRARVWSLPDRAVAMAISCSHLVIDFGSRNIILDELQDALGSGRDGAREAIPYNEFSLAERDYLAGPQGATLIDYWRRWYAASPTTLSPIEKTPLLWGVGTRIVNNFVIPRRVLQAVRLLAGQLRSTPFAVHLTIFSLALGRWSRAEDFTLRILGDKRTALELSDTVGLMFCADPIAVHAPAGADFETVLRGIMREYDASLALRLPSLHFYPPQAVRPGIEPLDHRVKIPAVFNYYSAGTQREKAEGEAAPDATAALAWPPQVQRMPPAIWTRPSAPVFLHLMDYGPRADCSLHFFAGVVSEAEQQAFIDMLFRVYGEVVPA